MIKMGLTDKAFVVVKVKVKDCNLSRGLFQYDYDLEDMAVGSWELTGALKMYRLPRQ